MEQLWLHVLLIIFELISWSPVNAGKYLLPNQQLEVENVVILKTLALFAIGISSAGHRCTQNAAKGNFGCSVK